MVLGMGCGKRLNCWIDVREDVSMCCGVAWKITGEGEKGSMCGP